MTTRSLLRGKTLAPEVYLLNGLGVVGCPLPACYTYALDTGEGVVLIDPGLIETVDRVRKNLEVLGLSEKPLLAIFLTHAHGDHVLAAGHYADGGRVPVYASSYAAELLNRDIVMAFKEDPAYVRRMVSDYPVVRGVADQERFVWGNTELQVIYTPGHSPGCISLHTFSPQEQALFIGDLIFPDGTVGHVGARSFSAQDVLASLRRVLRLDMGLLAAGHFYKTGDCLAYIREVLQQAEDRLREATR